MEKKEELFGENMLVIPHKILKNKIIRNLNK